MAQNRDSVSIANDPGDGDLHARLLAEIERREEVARAALGSVAVRTEIPIRAEMRSASGEALFRFDERRMMAADRSTIALAQHFCDAQPPVVLAYLGALRKIALLHVGAHQCHDLEGTVTIVRDECATLMAVAEGLGVEV